MSPLITLACLIGALCWSGAAATDTVQEGNGIPDLKLLFVGNSLLYYNGGVYKVQPWSRRSFPSLFPYKVERQRAALRDGLEAPKQPPTRLW